MDVSKVISSFTLCSPAYCDALLHLRCDWNAGKFFIILLGPVSDNCYGYKFY